MLILKDIVKNYYVGSETVQALKGVSINFRENEFVSILGASGCGKTTLLNIIGGLDQYTTGDLIINNKSTKKFKDKDWDTYRNHSIGFVFQSYNLIPHQTVLSNVELALTLSGVSKKERRVRAIEALTKVGLKSQINKKPNQMSGGQMQRVAIARALVNNPDILLADEPTGALDSTTSEQVMDILKEISADKLIIMVTHNADIAYKYSTRIISLKDGLVTDDTNPCNDADTNFVFKEIKGAKVNISCPKCGTKFTEVTEKCPNCGMRFIYKRDKFKGLIDPKVIKENQKQNNKRHMSFKTALSLSFNNLMTKKARTFLTSFACSIGIIGIALILSLSSGFQNYIDLVQKDTLSEYPVSLQEETQTLENIMSSFADKATNEKHEIDDNVYVNSTLVDLMDAVSNSKSTVNDLKAFKKYIEENKDELEQYVSAISYTYNVDLQIYSKDASGKIIQTNPSPIMNFLLNQFYGSSSLSMASSFTGNITNVFCEILPGLDGELVSKVVADQYDVIYGKWPEEDNEVVLVVNERNEIGALAAYALGLEGFDQNNFLADISESRDMSDISWDFNTIVGLEYTLLTPEDRYKYNSQTNSYDYLDLNSSEFTNRFNSPNTLKIRVSGIVRQNKNAAGAALSGSVAYTSKLNEKYIELINNGEMAKKQMQNKDIDIFTGKAFVSLDDVTSFDQKNTLTIFANSLTEEEAETYYLGYYGDTKALALAQTALQSQLATNKDFIVSSIRAQLSLPEYSAYAAYFNGMTDDELLANNMVQGMLLMSFKEQVMSGVKNNTPDFKEALVTLINDLETDEDTKKAYDYYKTYVSDENNNYSSYESNLEKLGVVSLDSPSSINIYPISFENKDNIEAFIEEYNSGKEEENQIKYTDYIGALLSGITTIIDAVTYVLIGFVSISLVVSSIMIGIITYVSVLERTKEIGILRAVGASKKDISRVFNAETLIVGFTSGMLGIGISALIDIPITLIVQDLTEITALVAAVPPLGAIALVVISMFLTFIAGLVPSSIAAKKDPVVALRTE